MSVFRKLLCIFFVCIIITAVFPACGSSDTDSNDIDSSGSDTSSSNIDSWEVDKDTHWHLTENGERVDEAAHTLEYNGCDVCNIGLYYDDGSIYLQKSNENGDVSVMMTYDSEGNLAEEIKIDFIYNENGNVTREIRYRNGKLYLETDYTVVCEENDYSYSFVCRFTWYNEDGTKLVEDVDRDARTCFETLYNADGSVAHEYSIEAEYDNRDNLIRHLKYDGDTLAEEVTYEYDELGNLFLQSTFVHGILVREEFYTCIPGDEYRGAYSYMSRVIIYNEDGTQTVTEYDLYGRGK